MPSPSVSFRVLPGFNPSWSAASSLTATLALAEAVEGAGGDVRVPGAGEAFGGDALAGYLSRPTRTVVRTISVAAVTPSVVRMSCAACAGTPGPLCREHPVGPDALAGLGAGGVAEGRLDEQHRAGHADEQGERSDDGGHPGGVSAEIGGGEACRCCR